MLRKKLGGQIRLTDPERRRGEADADLSASQPRAIEVTTARPSVTSAQLAACTSRRPDEPSRGRKGGRPESYGCLTLTRGLSRLKCLSASSEPVMPPWLALG
jgi:hypothetical protein